MSSYPPDKFNKKKRIKQYVKYSGLPYQLVGLTTIFAFIGYKLDKHFQNTSYYWTASLILVAFGVFMYKLFKMVNSKK